MLSPSIKLKNACFAGDLDEARRLLNAGADPNATDEHGSGTLLTFHSAMIEFLLSRGADPNAQVNENGSSVLAGLAHVGQLECVRVLLLAGADPNRGREASGETPLHHALVTRSEDRGPIVKMLLDHGANPNARTAPGIHSFNYGGDLKTRGETPLHRAAAYGTIETIRMLLIAGADPTIRDVNGDSPHTWALWHLREKPVLGLLQSPIHRIEQAEPRHERGVACSAFLDADVESDYLGPLVWESCDHEYLGDWKGTVQLPDDTTCEIWVSDYLVPLNQFLVRIEETQVWIRNNLESVKLLCAEHVHDWVDEDDEYGELTEQQIADAIWVIVISVSNGDAHLLASTSIPIDHWIHVWLKIKGRDERYWGID